MEKGVVGGYLAEDLGSYSHRRSLIFDDDAGTPAFFVVEHAVGAAGGGADAQGYFVGKEGGGIVLMGDEEVDKMLAYPFLRSETDVAAAQSVEDVSVSVVVAHFYFVLWQVEWNHFRKFARIEQGGGGGTSLEEALSS